MLPRETSFKFICHLSHHPLRIPDMLTTRVALLPLRRSFSSTAVSSSLPTNNQHQKKHKYAAYALAAVSAMSAASIYTRHIRHEKVTSLTSAEDSGLLSRDKALSIIETIKRAGLMGSTKSVKEELDLLRRYHIENGYHGGLIVRDLSQPLFSLDEGNDTNTSAGEYGSNNSISEDEGVKGSVNVKSTKENGANLSEKKMDMAQRECYYLYYEIKPNGHKKQEIFCRGTTLLVDVLTCLESWFVYDQELGCHVHRGFKKHADRVVEDVLPLLAKPSDLSTVEVSGHSLGGAVAMLVAVKLKKRGYRVTNVLSVAGPRVCSGYKDRDILESLLPRQTIRIENDLDIVPFLPPSGVSPGDKLWLVLDKGQEKVFMLPKEWLKDPMNSWAESVLFNLKLFETIWNQSKTHKIATHVTRLKNNLKDIINE
mmetsp:Transcript_28625/g.57618  ORF Transcript_28625/g.57618 Transcript_28625/m.57618 type:complete len:426 (+) Transcript_28625:214-1491(+)